jgi:hypothetical protein
MNVPHLATKMFNVPLALHPDKARIVIAAPSGRLAITRIIHANGGTIEPAPPTAPHGAPADQTPHYRTAGSEIISVSGTLVRKHARSVLTAA